MTLIASFPNFRCVECNLTLWPDDESARTCEKIEASYLKWTDTLSLGLTALTMLGNLG